MNKYLQTLELDKILAQLAEHCAFAGSRDLAAALRPAAHVDDVRQRQQETAEAKALLSVQPGLSVGGARDVRPFLRNAAIGATLDAEGLLAIQATLVSARVLRRSVLAEAEKHPTLANIVHRVEECPKLVAEITRCINDRGEVVDTASAALARIRRSLVVARDRLLERLNRLVGSPEYGSYLQDALITQRSGRYVVPIKAEHKGRIPGIVHDQSASGATIFVEPLAMVEMGNEWRQLQIEEQHEVERILAELTALVAVYAEPIQASVEALADLDLAFAKAKYAFATRATAPEMLVDHGSPGSIASEEEAAQHPYPLYLRLNKARHPLLPAATVVPIDVHLGESFAVLIVTGPNTGGKTVALRTVGLLAAMAQCGLHLPTAEGSALRVFSGIYADIGDEQSIEQSLSTFSSHMSNIVAILNEARSDALVLLDELGAGTDPTEGAALAQTILGELLQREIPTMGTTHYAELKLFAQTTPGVTNASVEFDVGTLSPTYRLTIGLPGRSNAFAIARRLGLDSRLIDEASKLISEDDAEADRILERIRHSRHEAGRATNAAQTALNKAREREKEARRLLQEAERQRSSMLAEAQAQLEAAQEELRRVRETVERQQVTQQWLQDAAGRVQKVAVSQKALAPKPSRPVDRRLRAEPIAVGDTVWIASLDQIGQVSQLLGREAEVQVGAFRAKVAVAELEKRSAPQEPGPSRVRVSMASRPFPNSELQLLGKRVEEALPLLEKYLDDAYLAGLPFARIVHGKGTGVLRQVVKEALSDSPLVASFKAGELNEGGDGVTVVKFHASTEAD